MREVEIPMRVEGVKLEEQPEGEEVVKVELYSGRKSSVALERAFGVF
jgi:hypothetical protein